jgi:hypothetical protein
LRVCGDVIVLNQYAHAEGPIPDAKLCAFCGEREGGALRHTPFAEAAGF